MQSTDFAGSDFSTAMQSPMTMLSSGSAVGTSATGAIALIFSATPISFSLPVREEASRGRRRSSEHWLTIGVEIALTIGTERGWTHMVSPCGWIAHNPLGCGTGAAPDRQIRVGSDMLPIIALATASGLMPIPVMLDPRAVLTTPSPAARAATGEEVALPAVPRAFTLQCSVEEDSRRPLRCAPVGRTRTDPTPTRDPVEFGRRADWRDTGTAEDALWRVAVARVRLYRLRELPAAAPAVATVLITETLASADRIVLPPPVTSATRPRILYEVPPNPDLLSAYYPPAALRAEIAVAMRATCRIMADRTLFCRDANAAEGSVPVDAAMFAQFAVAMYQIAGTVRVAAQAADGSSPVGRDVTLPMVFRIED